MQRYQAVVSGLNKALCRKFVVAPPVLFSNSIHDMLKVLENSSSKLISHDHYRG